MERADLVVSLDSSTGRSGPRGDRSEVNDRIDRLARMPGTTDETKHIQRGRDRVTDGH